MQAVHLRYSGTDRRVLGVLPRPEFQLRYNIIAYPEPNVLERAEPGQRLTIRAPRAPRLPIETPEIALFRLQSFIQFLQHVIYFRTHFI